jgi:hypothetical protein
LIPFFFAHFQFMVQRISHFFNVGDHTLDISAFFLWQSNGLFDSLLKGQ